MAVLNSTVVNGNLTVQGTVIATGFSTISDKNLKENIKAFKPEASILDLPLYTFNYKGDSETKIQIGCLAQDVKALFPELVFESEDGKLSINEAKLVYPLLLELKSQKEEIKALKAEIAELKERCLK